MLCIFIAGLKKGMVMIMSYRERAKQLVGQMTPEEKAGLCSGKDFWHLKGVERLGLKSIMVTDGPHGLRKQAEDSDHLGLSVSVPATSFPTASATACSFDRQLLKTMGEALGEKCVSEQVAVLLGPGINIKRSPLCGRNFEYFSEDPYLSGEMGAALIEGIQSKNVGSSLKHFAANNQEAYRMVVDSVVDERALHEIYLSGFEKAVKQAKPWTVMCSYNKINGTFASDHKYLLSDILRDKWGYEGLVVSDWGAMNDRVEGVKAGMDLEMPGPNPAGDKAILAALKNGTLTEEDLNLCAERITELILRGQEEKPTPRNTDAEHHKLAGEIAKHCAVLLKNEENILPLATTCKLAIIGEMAKKPRYQGAGSSKINPAFLDNAYDELKKLGASISYAPGYSIQEGELDAVKLGEAEELAKSCDVAIVFAGLPDEYESEGFDRTTLSMPESHNKLVELVAKANPNTVVVLQCGAPVTIPWKDQVKGILLMYLAGQAGGTACAELLLGKANPSGKLAETFPKSLKDTPCVEYFPGEPKAVQYRESIYVGYRYYDTVGVPVEYPFGYGLSYSTFEYSQLSIVAKGPYDYDISVTVTNTGTVAGAEIVQLYIHCNRSAIFRAHKELKGFDKVYLEPGEAKTITMKLNKRSFTYYNTKVHDWCLEGGTYQVLMAASSEDIRLMQELTLAGDGKEDLLMEDYQSLTQYRNPTAPLQICDIQFETLLGRKPPLGYHPNGEPFTLNSTIEDIKDTFIGKMILKMSKSAIKKVLGDNLDPTTQHMAEAAVMESPIRSMRMMTGGTMSDQKLEGIVALANGRVIKGIGRFLRK